MKKHFISIILVIVAVIALPATGLTSESLSRCADKDTACRNFEQFLEAQQPEKIIEQYNSAIPYSEDARIFIGEAYLAMASRDNISPDVEESYYRRAIEVKHNIAYMGLYFFYAVKDEEMAIGFLRDYLQTRPADTVPYVILGEYELNRMNYELADSYLRLAKQVAHAHSPRVDWLLFQTSYLLKNFTLAKEMFESAVTKGKFDKELKALTSDPRFSEISKRPEFSQFCNLLKVAMAYN